MSGIEKWIDAVRTPVLRDAVEASARRMSDAELVAAVRWEQALDELRSFNDSAELDRLTAECVQENRPVPPIVTLWLAELAKAPPKRGRGRPQEVRATPEDVAQLVELSRIKGRGFSNTWGDAGNETYLYVAAQLRTSPYNVRRLYESVPAERRQEIARWLRKMRSGEA